MTQPVEKRKQQESNQIIVSNLQRLWEQGGTAITVQLPPLLTADAGDFVKQVAAQADLFDAVVAADAPGGAVAWSSLAMAALLKRVGIETIVQFSGRDRNRLALQSDILSLGALGIPNLLIDMRPVVRASLVQNTDARLVTDLDGPALLAAAIRLRDEAHFISGFNVKTPPALYVGAFAALEEQIQVHDFSSAQFVVTGPVYNAHGFAAVLATFRTAYPNFLQTRPLLVSLPLITDFVVENAADTGEAREADIQKIVSSIELLKALDEIRGFNIIVSEHTDLALLEQIVRRANLHSVGLR